MKYTPKLPDETVNYFQDSLLKEALTLIVGFITLLAVVYWALGLAVDFTANNISPAYEQKLFKSFINISPSSNPKYTTIQQRMQEIVDSMLQKSKKLDIHLKVIAFEWKEENAFAVPGGYIMISTKLIDKARSENEIAMVLGHEIGHFVSRDHLRGLGRGLILTVLSSLAFGEDYGRTFNSLPLQLVSMNYSRQQESTADETGLELLNLHYGHTQDATSFFERIGAEMADSALPGEGFFSTHPYPLERVKIIKDLIQKKKYKESGKQELISLNSP